MQRRRPEGMSDYELRENLIVRVHLPAGRTWTAADVYPHVYGMHLDRGAKPRPSYRDPKSGEWFSLSTPSDAVLTELVWLIHLGSLSYEGERAARSYLESLFPALEAAASRLGATAEPECTPDQALALARALKAYREVAERRARVLIAAPEGESYSIREWWDAFVGAGLQWGDGDLFWLYSKEGDELLCAEPYTVPGYFHPRDRSGSARLPNVSIHFRIRDADDPAERLELATRVAEQVARSLGARLLSHDGSPFDLSRARAEVQGAARAIAALE